MGYYVQLVESDVVLKNEDLPEILSVLKALNGPEHNQHKRGGRWAEGKQVAVWYSWMPEDYDKTMNSVEEILGDAGLGFYIDVMGNGDIHITGYDNKTGAEEYFFQHLAKFIEDGSTMNWVGEDHAEYTWLFEEGKLYV